MFTIFIECSIQSRAVGKYKYLKFVGCYSEFHARGAIFRLPVKSN